jgi:hypothetical protein
VKNQAESRYKSTKADLQKEYNKEKTEIEKKVEVMTPQIPTTPKPQTYSKPGSNAHRNPAEAPWLEGNSMEVGGRWYGAFGGFGGLGVFIGNFC